MSASSSQAAAPPSSPRREEGGGTAAAISESVLSSVTPMVQRVDAGIQGALDSQAQLGQQIDRVASQLQTFLNASQLPSFAPYAQRLAEVRRRAAAANGLGEHEPRALALLAARTGRPPRRPAPGRRAPARAPSPKMLRVSRAARAKKILTAFSQADRRKRGVGANVTNGAPENAVLERYKRGRFAVRAHTADCPQGPSPSSLPALTSGGRCGTRADTDRQTRSEIDLWSFPSGTAHTVSLLVRPSFTYSYVLI